MQMKGHDIQAKRWFYWIPAVAYMGLIFFLSSQSFLPTPVEFPNADKVLHMGEYGILSGLLVLPGLPPFAAFTAASAYGATDEFHQRFVPGRDGNLWDWAADATGAFLASAMLFLWQRHRS